MIYITGAAGKLGRYVYELLSEKHDAAAVVRKPSGLKNEIVSDFSGESLNEIFRDAHAVVHLAGIVTYDKKLLKESNVELTKRIVDATPEKAKIIYSSSISVYGKKVLKKPVDEQTPVNPDSDYSRSKYEAEKIVSTHPHSVILRLGAIYGPFEDYRLVLDRIKNGKMFIIGDGRNLVPFISAEDAAKVILSSLNKRGVYNIVADQLTQDEIYRIAADELGVEPPSRHVSFFVADTTAWIKEKLSGITGGKPRITREHVAILYHDRPFDCSKAKKELGFSPIGTEEGIRRVVRELQKSL